MNDLDKQEAAQIAQVDAQAEKSKRAIREYFAMIRRGLFDLISDIPPSQAAATPPSIDAPRKMRAGTQKLIDMVLQAIHDFPADQYTFPEIKESVDRMGHQLTRDELRRVMTAIVGKAPAFQVQPRHGSVPGVYSRVPVIETAQPSFDTRMDFHSQNGHPLPQEEHRI